MSKNNRWRFNFGKEYKYFPNGAFSVEKFYQTKDLKPITETSVFLKNSYHLQRDNYTGFNLIVELSNWKKGDDGTIIAKKLLEGGKVRTITGQKRNGKFHIASTTIEDYIPHLYKIPEEDAPIQTLDKLD